MRQDPETHTFLVLIDSCDTLGAVLSLKTNRRYSVTCKGDGCLMKWLGLTAHIIFTFLTTLGEGIGLVSITRFMPSIFSHSFSPAKVIFTGIGVLLG